MTTVQPRPKSASKTPALSTVNSTSQATDRTRKIIFRLPSLPQLAAVTAGAVFTIASAATNFTYATAKFQADPTQQAIWGGVAVAASIILAIAPSAFVHSMKARSWGGVGASLLAVLIFGGYSVTAALGSATGWRMVAGLDAGDATTARTTAVATIEAKTKELAALAPTRITAELQAELDRLEGSRKDLNDCMGWLPDVKARSVCIQIADVRAEAGRASRRGEIEGEIVAARQSLTAQPARSTVANTDAVALQGFASALGWTVSIDTLNRLLVLASVLVIELGGGLAFAVAGGLGRVVNVVGLDDTERSIFTVSKPEKVPVHAGENEGVHGVQTDIDRLTVSDDAAERFVQMLKDRGGEVFGGQRTLAKVVGVSVGAMNALLKDLAEAGRVNVVAGKNGTIVRLAA
jgi:hypothetical protein